MTTKKNSILRKLLFPTLVVALCLTLFVGCGKEDEPDIDASFISSKLETMSELVSAKLTYNGVIHYQDGNVPFFTQKEFLMVYCAEVKAGIDLAAVGVEVTDTEVTITVPEDIAVDVKVDPNSITFYAEKTSLFNKDEKEDAVAAIQAAEEHVLEHGGIEELKSTARKEAVLLITNLVESLIGERNLVVLS